MPIKLQIQPVEMSEILQREIFGVNNVKWSRNQYYHHLLFSVKFENVALAGNE